MTKPILSQLFPRTAGTQFALDFTVVTRHTDRGGWVSFTILPKDGAVPLPSSVKVIPEVQPTEDQKSERKPGKEP